MKITKLEKDLLVLAVGQFACGKGLSGEEPDYLERLQALCHLTDIVQDIAPSD